MCSIAGALCSIGGASCSVAGAVIFSIASGSILTIFFLLHLLRSPSRPPRSPPPCAESYQYPLIGNLIGFLRNRHRFHDWISDMLSQSSSATIQVNTFLNLSSIVCTADPLNVEHLLATNFPNYIKGPRYQSVLHELIGDGIFAVDGHLWATQRKIASYEFSTNSLKSFVSETVNSGISDRLIPFLSDACGEDRIIDLQEVLQKFTFDNLCKVAFGIDPHSLLSSETLAENSNSVFVRAMDDANEIVFSRFMSPLPALWKIKRFLNIGSEKRFSEAIESINEFAMNIIRSKEGKTESDLDLLSRFMASSSNLEFHDGEQRRKFLRDVIISFILAGKDSTSTALTWFFWIISIHPQSEHRILNELSSESPPRGRRIFSYDELKQLHYTHAAVTESMRLFPPVPINSRTTVDDDVLPDGTRVGRGWFADYSAYAMGRSEKLWGQDRLEFRPERWLDDAGKFQPPNQFRFPVFHCGPRVCLGKEMAYVQMKSIVAAVMAEFEVVPVAAGGGGVSEQPTYVLSMQLKMKGGLPVRLRRRRKI